MADETRFWPLKKGIPTDEELSHLADNMPQDWKRLGVALGLKEKYLNAIEMNKPNDVFERALAVLQKWKKKMGRKATYHKLAEALNDQLVRRPDLVKRYSTDLEDSNIWKLKTGIPTDQELQRLAEEIPDDWKRIGRAVGLKEKHLKMIEIDNAEDVCERALATLYKWKEKQGREATYVKLAAALDDSLVQRRDLVEGFCCDVFPKSSDVICNLDGLDLLTDLPKEEKDGDSDEEQQVRPQRKMTLESVCSPEEQEQKNADAKGERSSINFQETLHQWKKRESFRETKGRTPSWRVRQSNVSTASAAQLAELTGEIQQIRDRVDAVLHQIQSCSTTEATFPAVVLPKEDVTDKIQPHEETVVKSTDDVNWEKAAQGENKDEALNKEIQKDKHEESNDFETDTGESNKGEADESPDSLFEELSSGTASYLWRWLIG